MSAGTCRVCGCTDLDCRGCIERTGIPCRWIEPDLCSACAPQPSAEREAASRLAMDAAHELAARYQLPAVLLVLSDGGGYFHAGVTTKRGHSAEGPMRVLAALVFDGMKSLTGGPMRGARPRVDERAACIHCMQEVALVTDVEAIKLHSVTCEKSPVVAQLKVARARIHELELVIATGTYAS